MFGRTYVEPHDIDSEATRMMGLGRNRVSHHRAVQLIEDKIFALNVSRILSN